MNPGLYLGTSGLSVWFSDDTGDSLKRLLSDSGLYSESRVWALSNHPAAPDEVLAGTDSGIYRFDRKETRWTHLDSPMDESCVWSVAQAPYDPDLILAGTRPPALFRSTDRGRSWSRIAVPFPETCPYVMRPRVVKILFDPDQRGRVWAALEIAGIWRSEDGGAQWEKCSQGLVSDDVHNLAVIRNGDSRLLFATTNKGLHVSRNGGDSWELRPLDSPWQYTRSVAQRADGSGVVLLTNGDGPPGSTGRLLRSRDFGEHWEDAQLPGEIKSTPWLIATNPADPNLIFVSTCLGQYFRSSDGGESWVGLKRELGETRALLWLPH